MLNAEEELSLQRPSSFTEGVTKSIVRHENFRMIRQKKVIVALTLISITHRVDAFRLRRKLPQAQQQPFLNGKFLSIMKEK